jgi:p-hydroxybenzoate 3-monooxygenase
VSVRTKVAVIGAGPAGLMLAHLLTRAGIETVIIERHSRSYVENRIRAGILEHEVAALLRETGVGGRMDEVGFRHDGTNILVDGALHRLDFASLGKHVMLYSQHEVVRDLIAARLAAGGEIIFEAEVTAIEDFNGSNPRVCFTHQGESRALDCAIIAACDGFHGIGRATLPVTLVREYDREYPFGWLGILAEAPPSLDELIYVNHDRGFALLSMRSSSVSRLYLQCPLDTDLTEWPDSRIWDELSIRLAHPGFSLNTGAIFQKNITPMRSYVAEPMQSGRLFLAGDAAHIVPPTGAKGLNAAVADAVILARAIMAQFLDNDPEKLRGYTETCLARIWKIERFSWLMTSLLHRFDDHSAFDRRIQRAELDYYVNTPTGRTALIENYVGLPIGAVP